MAVSLDFVDTISERFAPSVKTQTGLDSVLDESKFFVPDTYQVRENLPCLIDRTFHHRRSFSSILLSYLAK
jgi:hypothetical protein